MSGTYFSHVSKIAENRWDRRRFIAQWRRIAADDNRWVPPYYPRLRWALDPTRNRHIGRMESLILHVEALPRTRLRAFGNPQHMQLAPTVVAIEQPVAAGVILLDSRRGGATAHLALLRCVNDPTSLRHLLGVVGETLWPLGCRRLIGPTGLSPHLGTGLLQDHWDETPPLYTPYHPPFMSELVAGPMRAVARSRLYHVKIPHEPPPAPPTPAHLSPLDPSRLKADLLSLLVAAYPSWAGFVPPDTDEADFLIQWLRTWPLRGWMAEIHGEPVGFILLQSDLSPHLRRSGGGGRWYWRYWLTWMSRRPTRWGRLLAGAVLPRWQGRGIGRQLLHQALVTSIEQGWQNLTIGPLPTTISACAFLERQGARPRQTYLLYRRDL